MATSNLTILKSEDYKVGCGLNTDCLIDGFIALHDECTHDELYKIKAVSSFVKKYDTAVARLKETRMKASDFEQKAVIGKGHFGEVRVVKEKATRDVYAMKVLRKSDLLSQLNISFFEEERDIMASSESPWITRLHFAFQDSANLYLVMDFHPGGDLLSLLSRHDDILEESMAKFYIAETAIAIHSLHRLGYLHRDIKPENILLDHSGHVKLADFGSAAKLDDCSKVLAEIPVGTPDYVAPELLMAMSGKSGRYLYGCEVDWWSLGVCAYEMLFGGMPFTSDHASMVTTYANIMNFKDSLVFPEDSDVSEDAKDLIRGLLTDRESRIQWQDIENHSFFSDICWESIRKELAAFVPSICGLDDTSNFEEVEQHRRQIDVDSLTPQRNFSGRDLPFVGFTFSKDFDSASSSRPSSSTRDSIVSPAADANNSNVFNTACFMDASFGGSSPSKSRCKSPGMARRDWNGVETKAVSILEGVSTMNKEIESIEDELMGVRFEEMKSEIILLEAEQEKLMSKLMTKERQLEKTEALLEECQKKLEMQQLKLDKERRKSRDDQRKDLVLMEVRAETWQNLLEEKQATIDELNHKLSEYKDLVEAFEESEEKQAEEVEHLKHKLNTSIQDLNHASFTVGDVQLSGDNIGEAKVELNNLHHRHCPSQKKLTLHVTVKAGRCSFVDNKTLSRLQELQTMVDIYASKARDWRIKEEDLNSKITSLETESRTLAHKEGMGRKMKETLMEKMALYQKEISEQKSIIKDLQEVMKQYLSQSSQQSDAEEKLKDAISQRLKCEKQLANMKGELESMRQAALSKTNEMQEAIQKLEEQRGVAEDYKNRYDCQMALMEVKLRPLEEELARVTADRQRLERREASLTTQVESLQGLLDEKTLEAEKLEGRNTDLQSHLHLLQQRNSDLHIEVEKFQKVSAQNDEQKQSKAELNFQVKRLQQEKTDLEHRIVVSRREKHGLEDKISMADREKERLMRRIDRLEHAEKEKHELESKVEKISVLERENRRLTTKVDRLTEVEKDKLNLEEKLDKLRLELQKEKINLESAIIDKKSLETKLEQLKNRQGAENSVEMTRIKTKLSLLETVEKEKAMCEKEKDRLNDTNERLRREKMELEKTKLNLEAEKSELVKQGKATDERIVEMTRVKEASEKMRQQKMELEKTKLTLEAEKSKLEEQSKAADERIAEMTREKEASEKLLATLNQQVSRLESSIGSLQGRKSSSEGGDVRKLRSEIDRLTAIVDQLELDKKGIAKEEVVGKRNSSNLVEKLQLEKAGLQRQLEAAEREAASSSRSRIETNRQMKKESELKEQLEKEMARANQMRVEKEKINVQLEEELLRAKRLQEEKENIAEKLKGESFTAKRMREEKEKVAALLEKQEVLTKQLTEEKDKMAAQHKKTSLAIPEASRKSGEHKFEKMQLDNKIKELTEERDQLEKRLADACSSKTKTLSASSVEVEEIQKQFDEYKKEMEIRLGASKFPGGDISAYLRHEINESNLALSEARSSLSASKRRELELRDKIDQLQRTLDNRCVENAKYLQNAKDAMAELKDLMSQHDTLRRQHKALEEKHSELLKQRGSNSSETVRLMDDMASKTQQYAMERKKTEKLAQVCSELEEQVQDLELAIAEADKREAEWNKIKKTYEEAASEKDSELQGASCQLQEVCLQRSEVSERMKQQLESVKALHKADVEQLNHQLREEKAKTLKMATKMNDMGEKESSSVMFLESQKKEMDKLAQEKLHLKEELAEALNDSCNYRKENLKLSKHLEDAMVKFELIIGEKVSIENFAEALQGLHFLEKYKFESTIGQQMKLIDYLQELYVEHSGKKKKGGKFFGGSKGNSSKDLSSLPFPWKDLQTALEQERSKVALLQDQVDRLREENFQQANELLKFGSGGSKQDESSSNGGGQRLQANLTVKVTPAAMKALSSQTPVPSAATTTPRHATASSSSSSSSSSASNMVPASSTNSLTSIASTGSNRSAASASSSSSSSSSQYSSSRKASKTPRTPGTQGRSRGHHGGHHGGGRSWKSVDAMPTPQRMHHNIPHRFTTGLNSRATKCGLCLGSVHFVRQASKCQDCGMVVHPKCASSVPASCGLPTEYVRHFALMMSTVGKEEEESDDEFMVDETAIKMEGWLRVPRVGTHGWEKRYCKLEGNWLTLFLDDADANPVDSFDLNPPDSDVSVHSAVSLSELSNNIAASDLCYVLRLDQDPFTTCWPGRYLYLMTTSFPEKQRWVASLEAVVKCAQCNGNQRPKRSDVLTVMSLKGDEQREFNCSLTISSQLELVGTDDGLFAFNPQAMTNKRKQMTQLSGFGSVHQMLLAKGVDLILILTGPERRLIMLENKLVKSRMSQTLGGETTPLTFRTVEGLQECTVFDVGVWNRNSYLCVGTPKKIYLMRYNHSLSMYCVRKEFLSTEPCSCVCIAENYAIVGTDRFYKINMDHPSMLDFVDRQDSTLAFAAYHAANNRSFPLAVIRVSPPELPLEFLLCIHECGVFVDHRGQRSRPSDVKWSGFPLAFAYCDPFLYTTYFNSVQATVIPTDKSIIKGRQTVVDLPCPRYLGRAPRSGSVYISTVRRGGSVTEILQVRGQDDYCLSDDDGNTTDKENLARSHDRRVKFESPSKTPKTPQINRLRRQGSLTSLNSNSSGSTFVSVESNV